MRLVMFNVDRDSNGLRFLQATSFSSPGFCECEHFQAWRAKNRQALTRESEDERLIVKKAFAGFDEVKARPGFLTRDKKGSWVMIGSRLNGAGQEAVAGG